MKLTPINIVISLLIAGLLAVGWGLWTRRRQDATSSKTDASPDSNIAHLATLTTSSTHPEYFLNPKSILDPVMPTSFSWGQSGWNDNTRGSFPDWVVLDWGYDVRISSVTVASLAGLDQPTGSKTPGRGQSGGNMGLKDYVIQAWNGADWQTVATVTGNDKDAVTSPLPAAVTTPKLRVYITATQDATWSRITQIQVQGKTA